MRHLAYSEKDGIEIPHREPNPLEWSIDTVTGFMSQYTAPKVVNEDTEKEQEERLWIDSEILRTNIPENLILYRAKLRDYPAQPDFPNGTRPSES